MAQAEPAINPILNYAPTDINQSTNKPNGHHLQPLLKTYNFWFILSAFISTIPLALLYLYRDPLTLGLVTKFVLVLLFIFLVTYPFGLFFLSYLNRSKIVLTLVLLVFPLITGYLTIANFLCIYKCEGLGVVSMAVSLLLPTPTFFVMTASLFPIAWVIYKNPQEQANLFFKSIHPAIYSLSILMFVTSGPFLPSVIKAIPARTQYQEEEKRTRQMIDSLKGSEVKPDLPAIISNKRVKYSLNSIVSEYDCDQTNNGLIIYEKLRGKLDESEIKKQAEIHINDVAMRNNLPRYSFGFESKEYSYPNEIKIYHYHFTLSNTAPQPENSFYYYGYFSKQDGLLSDIIFVNRKSNTVEMYKSDQCLLPNGTEDLIKIAESII